ncbi:MAG: hypothetical protein F6K11_29620, partial [Leptolyngbya sp. SIO3F4]|nr:hypothetical protein [Leptolyngbya sp. SIO3F4]
MLVWKVSNPSVSIASFRYRCMLPLRYLQQHDVKSVIYGGNEPVFISKKAEAIIFVKAFKERDLTLAEKAWQLKVPVILDLCDNIFIKDYGADLSNDCPELFFKEMAAFASAIVTTGAPLKEIIEREIVHSVPVFVIPDSNESLDDIDFAYAFITQNRWTKIFKYNPLSIFYVLNSFLSHKSLGVNGLFRIRKSGLKHLFSKRWRSFIKLCKQWHLKIKNFTLIKLRSKLIRFFKRIYTELKGIVVKTRSKFRKTLKKINWKLHGLAVKNRSNLLRFLKQIRWQLKGRFVKSRSNLLRFLKQIRWQLKGRFVKSRSKVRRLFKQTRAKWKWLLIKFKNYIKKLLNHFGLWELKSEDSELKSEDSELKSEDYIGYELEKVAGNLSII